MVSIRRRKLLGFCSGVSETGNRPKNFMDNTKPVNVSTHSLTEDDTPNEETTLENGIGSTKSSTSSPLEGPFVKQIDEIKHRKRHRRKRVENQDPCTMRGVYLKNAKWQAAIKVDKKQIHLGTVSSQEEAARLYDRAAFLCGREPNSQLSEDEKRELQKFKWDEFLAMTRFAITHKKSQRSGRGSQRNHPNNACEHQQN